MQFKGWDLFFMFCISVDGIGIYLVMLGDEEKFGNFCDWYSDGFTNIWEN